MAGNLLIARSLFRAGDRVCVAISGGADSTALLLALKEANAAKESLGVVVSAAHVHHGLRGAEADADEAFVRELCERLAVPLTVFHVDTAARQAAEREGVEEAARELRYEALRGLLAEGQVDAIATAHTLDDQAETVMMKLLRGAWTEGLGGISPELAVDLQGERRTNSRNGGISPELAEGSGSRAQGSGGGRVVRPLLGVRRAEVEAFLQARGQVWRTDSSNRDLELTRNRVRHELMPVLRSFNPCVDELLANMAGIARDEEAHWETELRRLLPQVLLPGKPVRGGGRAVSTAIGEAACSLEIERLKAMGAGLRRRVVRAAARSMGFRLNFEETAKLLALAGFGGYIGIQGKIGSRLELRAGLRGERSARELRLWRQ
ncbi:tRNA lysidine(34) synthetase TilS [Granulicella mallensis]|uniref:tRNA(Ile)-lysidine synthase n=1 Tax=Granulicella mallensis TaxID=940614 RepID=A0A7W7ZP51_9BACT|nr:tRNA lysidine(34) synthetase TilS [Granulicella mallensis]MBB5062726.1 tRNA(Ile)-lysidine synthase [Granulicella mallensis]